MRIRVPATTANMGPGFDCIGMALQLYNEIEVEEIEKGVQIEIMNKQNSGIPLDERNLIYQCMMEFCKWTDTKFKGVSIKQYDDIPMTRGLGSSAACIVSGLMAANELTGAKLSKKELAKMAALIEGHPDNAAPAVLGNMIIAAQDETQMHFVEIDVPKEIKCLTMIPQFELSTEKARNVLPKAVSLHDSVYNISRAALFVAKMLSGQLDDLDFCLEDRLHQPYRKKLIPHVDEIFEYSKKIGTKGMFISGAGPTLIALVDSDYDQIVKKMDEELKTLPIKWDVKLLDVDRTGAVVVK